jgi:hypothetical protein
MFTQAQLDAMTTGANFGLRSQVEIHIAIICASLPSLQPLFKNVCYRLPYLRRARAPYYYYGGGQNLMIAPPSAKVVQADLIKRDPTAEQPAPTYSLKAQMQEARKPRILVTQHITNDDIIRDRVRAFSIHTPSVHSPSTSPTYPSHIFTYR